MLSAEWRAECWNVLAINAINHTCQARATRSRKLSLSAVGRFCRVPWVSFIPAHFQDVCDCVSGSLCLFSQAATSLPPPIPHVSADKRWGITKHAGHMLAEITHAGLPCNISQEGRKGGMHHSDRGRMERDIPLLSPHTCTVRDL